jgi:hypothetical protein
MLDYGVHTNPDVLWVSNPATFTFVVSNGTHKPVEVTRLEFSFPVGKNGKDLTVDGGGFTTIKPSGWDFTGGGGVFTATPKTPNDGLVAGQGLTFILAGIPVNTEVGSFDLTITETSTTGTRSATRSLTKFPAQSSFWVGELDAYPLVVEPGGGVTLAWSGSADANYTLQYGPSTQALPPNTWSYRVDNLQQDPTVFYLIVNGVVADEPRQIQRECTVTVDAARITRFEASATDVAQKAPVTLSWTTENAESCALEYAGSTFPVATTGKQEVTPEQTTVYTLSCQGAGGSVDSRQITVTVLPVTINAFTEDDLELHDGDIYLRWSTTGAAACSIDQGIGPVAVTGTKYVSPQVRTTYTLTCQGLNGPVRAQLVVDPTL